MSDSQPKIIGEAAYALLVRREEVNVSSLLTELARMAEKAKKHAATAAYRQRPTVVADAPPTSRQR